jgi:hypothetical protein
MNRKQYNSRNNLGEVLIFQKSGSTSTFNPFMTFSGITDTDGWSGAGPIPFLIKRGFEGIIPAGTPIIQFSFIKREDWKSKIKEFDTKSLKKKYSVKKYIMHGYKKEYWKKKSYE